MSLPFVISFAGVVGSSKTPIAHYLSTHLGLPIYSNDTIRSEVIEDRGILDQAEYAQRRDQRLEALLTTKASFIYDASVDRVWAERKPLLQQHGYRCFLISLNLSRVRLAHMLTAKRYTETIARLDQLIAEHDAFLATHAPDINFHLTDQTFPNRLTLSLAAVQAWLTPRG